MCEVALSKSEVKVTSVKELDSHFIFISEIQTYVTLKNIVYQVTQSRCIHTALRND